MNQGPYRPNPPEGDAALERLAAEGKRAVRAAHANRVPAAQTEEKKRERNLRVALGVYYGTPLRTASYSMMGGSVLVMIVCLLGLDSSGVILFVGFFVVLGGFLVRLVVDPAATRTRVAAERAWAASLPFAMRGYFELLAEKPDLACQLVIELQWEPGRAPTLEIVQGVLGVWDTGANAWACEGETVGIRSGTLVCGYFPQSDIWEPRPTRRLVARVHRLVDRVLVPLHRSHAIACVSLKRETAIPSTKPKTVIDVFRDIFGS